MAVILYVSLPLPDGKLLEGGFFLAIGVLHVLFYKRTRKKFFARTQTGWRLGAKLWARIGEGGTQVLYLGIGIILAVAGCILVIAGSG